ncbi:PVC-type heme-binding CxxCH protein [Dyadobacter psychrophilus]|uniref:Putative membrane-bound dehydrogenase domain-containing protein n=1 Tax=Dyadobacter psychrophilus TaxID=651661 RepID=A0A1T5FUW3_9BACT|nr:PVC-type heme-binding CxxCH protein [Dyadobacter psychrophilus]SKB99922.1 putative membrane-bound dehydrogenase domain-containing protein [Dyadobacter psychrophilus]
MKQFNFTKSALLIAVNTVLLHFCGFCQLSDSLVVTNPDSLYATLSEPEKRFSRNAVLGLKVAEGLEASLFASEPDVINPINIDVDHRGRVWACEAYNYRPAVNGKSELGQGDRIVIMEDKDGDGKSDVTKVFYQGPELNAPLGIWVMGNKAVVSQSPYVWLFTDTNGDDKADKKEILFKGIGGSQSDAGIHAFVFGPDGKFYFNFGNAGRQLVDGQDRPLLDKYERPIDFRQFKQGVVFRCDQDFTKVEILAENFRIGFEVAVDSFGTMWQSDQEEPGNGGDRVSYVMENGNFGYIDEMTGASWRLNRTNLEDEIPRRHWHQNDPGVVPNLIETGSGFPMGITVYEGNLLPRRYWEQVLLADAGQQNVSGFPVVNDGAGYKSTGILPIVEGTRDKWFRPSDVCVAPDGSLIISDWYDPIIGSHKMKDRSRGRIFRVAPTGVAYKIPVFDLTIPEQAVKALQSPNLSMRYMAWNACVKHGWQAEPYLEELFRSISVSPRIRARALWVLNRIEGFNYRSLDIAFREMNPNLRITALRAVRQRNSDPTEYIKRLTADPDPQVRRECALAINHNHTYEALDVWLQLAKQYKGNDRWSVEALSIGAYDQWERIFPAWLARAGANPVGTSAGKDIVWLARTRQAIPYLTAAASDTSVSFKSRLRYFRAFDFFHAGYEKSQALLNVMTVNSSDRIEVSKLALLHLDKSFVTNSQQGLTALNKLLDETYGTEHYIDLMTRYELESEMDRLFKMALDKSDEVVGRDAGALLLEQAGISYVTQKLAGLNEAKKSSLLASIQTVGSPESVYLLRNTALDPNEPASVRKNAAKYLGASWPGEEAVVKLLREDRVTGDVKEAALLGVKNAFREEIKVQLSPYLPQPKDEKLAEPSKPESKKEKKRRRRSS